MSYENGRLHLVLSIDMPNTGQKQRHEASPQPMSPRKESPQQSPSPKCTPVQPQQPPLQEAVTPKQLILLTSSSDAPGTTKLAEISTARPTAEPDTDSETDADSGDAFLSARQRRQKQQAEMEQRLFRAPTRSDIQRNGSGGQKLVRFDEVTSSPAVVNLSGFFARQAARARPIFSPKFDRLTRKNHGTGTDRSRGVFGKDRDMPALLSLASLDVTAASNTRRQQPTGGCRRRCRRKSGGLGEASKLTMWTATTNAATPTPIPATMTSFVGCSDIVKRRQPQPPPSPVRIDIDLTPEGQQQQSPYQTHHQHQNQNHQSHQLSELLGRFHLPRNVGTPSVSDDFLKQPVSTGPFRLAEPRLKLNHFSSSRHPGSFYYLNTGMHIHTP